MTPHGLGGAMGGVRTRRDFHQRRANLPGMSLVLLLGVAATTVSLGPVGALPQYAERAGADRPDGEGAQWPLAGVWDGLGAETRRVGGLLKGGLAAGAEWLDAGARQKLVRVQGFNATAAVQKSIQKVKTGMHLAGEELQKVLESEAVRHWAHTVLRGWGNFLRGSSELGRRTMDAAGRAPAHASRLWDQAVVHVLRPAWEGIRECWKRVVETATRLASDAGPIALSTGHELGQLLSSAAALSRQEWTKASLWFAHRWMDAQHGLRAIGTWGQKASRQIARGARPLGQLSVNWMLATRAAGKLWWKRLAQSGKSVSNSQLAHAHVKLVHFYARHPIFRPFKAIFGAFQSRKAASEPGGGAEVEGQGEAS
eukprot:CAMPEP_0169447600 /NCGR_PEP_ID=MMETSP1042-20121227/11604_1 /TAXON_ID=464988 /ORGANISM="Hemiselmis andersenii, Strain CCMP1180" /LENGTH=368 /DNA_ID=CAMNT_0009559163 /DNA_START=58 /DNA_END=1161 /DNA_ORIENTATION=+